MTSKRILVLWLLLTDRTRFERVNYDSLNLSTMLAIVRNPPL